MDAKAKNPTVGVRLSPEELDTLEVLFPNHSKSEAIRLLISRAKILHEHPQTVVEAQRLLHEALGEHLPILQLQDGVRSVLLEDLLREASLILSTALISKDLSQEMEPQYRITFEEQIVNRCFDLMDTILRHSFTDSDQAFDPLAVRKRLLKSRSILTTALSLTSEAHRPLNQQ